MLLSSQLHRANVLGGVCHLGKILPRLMAPPMRFYIRERKEQYFVGFVLLIFLPVLAAIFVPFLFKKFKGIHTGWFVFVIPVVLFAYYTRFIPITIDGEDAVSTLSWIPSLGV